MLASFRPLRPSTVLSGLAAVFLLTTAQSCQGPVTRPPAPQPVAFTPLPVVLEQADQCGRGLGIAVRCNLVRSDSDFAVLRYNTLSGLRARAGDANFSQVEAALDTSTLNTIDNIGSCRTSRSDLAVLETQVEATLSQCTAGR